MTANTTTPAEGATSNAQIRQEMAEIQHELNDALHTLLSEVGKKLRPQERAEVEAEFNELNELLERMKTGMIWISLFGRTSAGKSAVINSLVDAQVAEVGVEHDLTQGTTSYRKEPWNIQDTPGVMGKPELEELAIQEARQAMGIIFVLEDIPYGPELSLFDKVHAALPNTPKLVFVNKVDRLQPPFMTRGDREKIQQSIYSVMRKYVASDEDIVYGSALRYDEQCDEMVRQVLPQLLDRMEESAGTLGAMVSVLDPADRAHSAVARIQAKVTEVRMKVARKVIGVFAVAEIASVLVPFSTLTVAPGLLGSMAYVIQKIMGRQGTRAESMKLAIEILKNCGIVLATDFVIVAGVEVALAAVNAIPIFGQAIFVLGGALGLGWIRYRRTVIFGEVALEYVRNDFSWGGEEPRAVIGRCRERALKYYTKFQKD